MNDEIQASALKWWQKQPVYQIYPRSFQDSNGDGIGDLPGIISRLDYIVELGIGIIWLSPVYKSPQVDYGYDISDYYEIAPEFGTMEDFDRLIAEAAQRGIRVVMDLVINHTSDQHQWFLQSRQPDSSYRDYYFWRPGRSQKLSDENRKSKSMSRSARKKDLPNNWSSFFGEDCWVYDATSGEYYLHLFAKGQPDLNYGNEAVLAEIKNILRFWLDKGVAGFRCDVINVIYKQSLDNGRKRLILTGSEHYLSKPGTHKILQELRADVFDNYDCFTVGETVFVNTEMGRDLCDPDRRELDMIFSFEHMETDQFLVKWFKRRFRPDRFGKVINRWQQALYWPANYLENHDQPRSVTRFGDDGQYWRESAKLLAVLLFTLKGTPFIFQGQEIGMTNFDYTSLDQLKDVESINIDKLARRLHLPSGYRWRMMQRTSRDNARTPMQWSSGQQADFSTGEPWLAVNSNFNEINVTSQKDDPDSIISFYKKIIRLRTESEILLAGEFHLIATRRKYLVYERLLRSVSKSASEQDNSSKRNDNDRRLLVILNFSSASRQLPYSGELILSNYKRKEFDGSLKPFEAVILKVKQQS